MELSLMRDRIHAMRHALVDGLEAAKTILPRCNTLQAPEKDSFPTEP